MSTELLDREWAKLDRVRAWKAEMLIRLGIPQEDAHTLAMCPYIDWHEASDLVEQGCPPELVFEILT